MSKIFIGTNDVASAITDLKQLYALRGQETLTMTFAVPSPIIIGKVDHVMTDYNSRKYNWLKPSRLREYAAFHWNPLGEIYKQAVEECDTFIFIWHSFTWDMRFIKQLHKLGKKIIFCYCGDDVRWYYSSKQEFEQYGMSALDYGDNYKYDDISLETRLRRTRVAEKYADAIFSRFDQAQLALRPYNRWEMFLNVINYTDQPIQREIPVVAHAPSNRKIKGTEFVKTAFDRLQNEGIKFIPRLIENMPNEQLRKELSDVDILIDQLHCPGTGKLASEGLASGCVVMARMAYDFYPQQNHDDCPVIDVGPETIYTTLKAKIKNLEFRKKTAVMGRPFAEKHLDYSHFISKVEMVRNGTPLPPYYTPTFFRDEYIPKPQAHIPLYNKYTDLVKDCDWYKESINSRERAGLIF